MKMNRIISPVLALILYLGVYEGKVALYRQGHKTPVQVFGASVSVFPREDQQALAAGIPIENQKQLSRLLEAYLN